MSEMDRNENRELEELEMEDDLIVFEDEDGNVYFVNADDGSVYAAAELDEESAAALIGE